MFSLKLYCTEIHHRYILWLTWLQQKFRLCQTKYLPDFMIHYCLKTAIRTSRKFVESKLEFYLWLDRQRFKSRTSAFFSSDGRTIIRPWKRNLKLLLISQLITEHLFIQNCKAVVWFVEDEEKVEIKLYCCKIVQQCNGKVRIF
jgi:hypothetical protein